MLCECRWVPLPEQCIQELVCSPYSFTRQRLRCRKKRKDFGMKQTWVQIINSFIFQRFLNLSKHLFSHFLISEKFLLINFYQK